MYLNMNGEHGRAEVEKKLKMLIGAVRSIEDEQQYEALPCENEIKLVRKDSREEAASLKYKGDTIFSFVSEVDCAVSLRILILKMLEVTKLKKVKVLIDRRWPFERMFMDIGFEIERRLKPKAFYVKKDNESDELVNGALKLSNAGKELYSCSSSHLLKLFEVKLNSI